MTAETENLILVMLRKMDERLASVETNLRNLRVETSYMRTQINTMEGHLLHATRSSDERIDRIERRLELRDAE